MKSMIIFLQANRTFPQLLLMYTVKCASFSKFVQGLIIYNLEWKKFLCFQGTKSVKSTSTFSTY